MLHKCANPACNAQYRYFSEGLLFEFYVDEARQYQPLSAAPSPASKREMFWLCAACSVTMTLECRAGEVVLSAGEKAGAGARRTGRVA